MSRNHDDYVEEVEDMDEVENHGPVVMGFNSDEDEDDEHAQANDKGSDTSSTEARCGKDIQGISWDRLAITREKYRQTRLEQYKNYENIPYSGEAAMKVCKSTEKGGTYYEFRRNTRSVKSTILHFQAKGNDHIRASRGDQNPQRVAHPSSPLLMDRAPAAGAGEDPSPATAESSSSSGQQEDSQWLATLSEPELDLLISLKMLAVTRAKTVGHPHLAHLFDLRTLRALGVVLLESFKERLKETSVDPSILDRFAPLSDSGADFINSGSDSEVVKPNKDQSTPNIVKKKRKQM